MNECPPQPDLETFGEWASPALAIVAAAISGCWAFAALTNADFGLQNTVLVTRDIAAVSVLCVLPLSSSINACLARPRFPGHLLAVALFTVVSLQAMQFDSTSLSIRPAWFRSCLIGVFVSSGLGLAAIFLTESLLIHWSRGRRNSVKDIQFAVSMCVAVVLPVIYVHARCHHEAASVQDLLEQNRFGEAQAKLRELLRLQPERNWQGRSIRSIASLVDHRMEVLKAEVADPLPESAGDDRRIRRGQCLAMLGRTPDALKILLPVAESDSGNPVANQVCGLILETERNWKAARRHHEIATQKCQNSPIDVSRTSAIARCAIRQGFCERKSGHYQAAEAYYLRALHLVPSADSHFLLAQFYEDMQQSKKAALHARQAANLDSATYRERANSLLDKLATSHFGCLEVSRQR